MRTAVLNPTFTGSVRHPHPGFRTADDARASKRSRNKYCSSLCHHTATYKPACPAAIIAGLIHFISGYVSLLVPCQL